MTNDRSNRDDQRETGPDHTGAGASVGAGTPPSETGTAETGRQGQQSGDGQPAGQQQGAAGGPGSGGPGQPGNRGPPGGDPGRRSFLKYGAVGAAAVGGWFVYDSVLADDAGGEDGVRSTLRDNIRAYESEDLQLLRSTLHPDSPAYQPTLDQSRQIFERYDLTYELTIHEVRIDGDSAEADVTQTTRSASGSDFRDNRLEATHSLQTYEGDWRIYDSTANDVEYL